MAYSGSCGAPRAVPARRAAVVALALCTAGARVALAEDQSPRSAEPPPPHVEAWSGAEVFPHTLSVYSGAVWAPFGSVREDGVRLRGLIGYEAYGLGHGHFDNGSVAFGDLLIGYHAQLGPLTIKIFGGLAVLDYTPDPGDPDPALAGNQFGGKGVLEAWWNIADQAWASLDLSSGTLDMDYASRVRLGWRFWPELSAGLEGGSGGTLAPALDLLDTARVGGFLRYEWASGEVSVSGGMAFEEERDGASGAFGTVAVLTRF